MVELFSVITDSTHTLIEFFEKIAEVIPLPFFSFIGSIIEEIIAPIPSPLVMTLAGTLSATQNQAWPYLILLAITGAFGKTIASYLIYTIADKFEDIVLTKFGKFLGVTHKQVEGIGRYLNKGLRDDIVLMLLRAIPIVPSAPISVICGLIKLNVRTYITSTFIGTFFRNIIYLAVGYTGLNATEALIVKMENFEVVVYGIIVLFIALFVGYLYYQRYKEIIYHKLFHNKETSNEDCE